MRLWHKDPIPYLPHQQLVAQWRELGLVIMYPYFRQDLYVREM